MTIRFQYLCIAVLSLAINACYGGSLVIDHRHTDITKLNQAQINRAKSVLHIAYGHTSHGSQLTDGMTGLVGFANGGGKGLALFKNAFAWNNGGTGGALDLHDYAMGGDVGYYPNWVNNTIAYLDNQKAYAAWALWCALGADLDRDGLPDEWEDGYGGTHRFGAGTNNFDNDTMTDWEEYVADTVPTNAASQFEIFSISATNDVCTLTFLSSPTRIYELRSSDDLKSGLWSVVGDLTIKTGTGTMMSLTDTNAAPFRAYRLGVSLP